MAIKHICIRIAFLVLLIPLSVFIGLSMLDSNRRCGTGDGLAIGFWLFIFYIIWSLSLFIEAYIFHKKHKIQARNINIYLALLLPALVFVLFLFFEIVEVFN